MTSFGHYTWKHQSEHDDEESLRYYVGEKLCRLII